MTEAEIKFRDEFIEAYVAPWFKEGLIQDRARVDMKHAWNVCSELKEAELSAERKYRKGLEHTILKISEAFDKAKNAKVICEDCGSALWRL